MTELIPGREVRAPHVFEVCSDVPAAEQTLAVDQAAVLRRLVLGYEGGVRVGAVDLDGFVVAEQFDAWFWGIRMQVLVKINKFMYIRYNGVKLPIKYQKI